jgi:hypothetical protein
MRSSETSARSLSAVNAVPAKFAGCTTGELQAL